MYSDRINHAFAFAAKHHAHQVRKGTRTPYLTHPANVALILARYGQDEDTIVAGILHDVVEDSVREGVPREMLEYRIGEKFGATVLETVLMVTKRKTDDTGVEMSRDAVQADYLARVGRATARAQWVCAADKVHNAGSILADLRRAADPEEVWGRFTGGRTGTLRWYRGVLDALTAAGFTAPILAELAAQVAALEAS